MQYYLGKIFGGESMTSYIKSKIQRSISFLIAMVIAFSVCSGVVLLNPTPSYAFSQADVDKAGSGSKDLSKADLSRADLSRANLSGANLSGAFLRETIFRGANLSGANLTGTILNWTDFREANLSGANLRGANLTGTIFRGANLRGANFREAGLSGVYFMGAIADRTTIFPKGFDAVKAGVIIK